MSIGQLIRQLEIVEVKGDIAKRPVEVIVNAWNRNIIPAWLLLPQGVSKAIRKAGGKKAIQTVSSRAPLPLGSAAETSGYRLPAKWVLHVAGINMLWRASEGSVRNSTINAITLARCIGANSIALPLIGAGSSGLSPATVKKIMLDEMRKSAQHFHRMGLVSFT